MRIHFGGSYEASVDLWHTIMLDYSIPIEAVHCHPDRPDHQDLWKRRGYIV